MTNTTHRSSANVSKDVDNNTFSDVLILHRVPKLRDLQLAPRGEGPFRTIGIIDIKTTGTYPNVDDVIDLALVTLQINGVSEIVRIISAEQGLQEPRLPIPPQFSMTTGITDADVQGLLFKTEMIEHRLRTADVLIAHCASFVADFIEPPMPSIVGAEWACSAYDFDWPAAGFDGRKLGKLLNQIGYFNDGHWAMHGVVSLVHLLAHRLANGRTVLMDLLANAAPRTTGLEATSAPFRNRRRSKRRRHSGIQK
jgi:DNA polymerase-3 subunit epsilon